MVAEKQPIAASPTCRRVAHPIINPTQIVAEQLVDAPVAPRPVGRLGRNINPIVAKHPINIRGSWTSWSKDEIMLQ